MDALSRAQIGVEPDEEDEIGDGTGENDDKDYGMYNNLAALSNNYYGSRKK